MTIPRGFSLSVAWQTFFHRGRLDEAVELARGRQEHTADARAFAGVRLI